mgnify:CR=1 FL=1
MDKRQGRLDLPYRYRVNPERFSAFEVFPEIICVDPSSFIKSLAVFFRKIWIADNVEDRNDYPVKMN